MFNLTDLLAQNQMMTIVDKLGRTPLSQIFILGLVLTAIRVALLPYFKKTPKHKRYGAYGVAKMVDGIADAIVYASIVVFMLVRPFWFQAFTIPSGSMIDTLLIGDFVFVNKWVYRGGEPKDGDIIVFKPPTVALEPGQDPGTFFIKRLIGSPGDTVEWKGKKMYRNGQLLQEPHAGYTKPGDPNGPRAPESMWSMIPQPDFKLVEEGGQVVPVQVMGDYVNNYSISMDMLQENTIGTKKPFWPKDKAQALKWKDAPPAKVPAGYYLFMGDNRNGSSDGRFWGLVPRESIVGRADFIWLPVARWRKLD